MENEEKTMGSEGYGGSSESAPVVPEAPFASAPESVPVKYAGFWIRYVANFIDGIVVGIPVSIIAILSVFLAGLSGLNKEALENSPVVMILRFAGYLLGWAYFIVMTKKYQATLGKMAVGIRVLSDKSENLGLGQIILRETLGKILSAIILMIGYIMAGFTKRKQALHDKVAGTVVVYKDPTKKNKGWIIGMVIFIGVMGFLAIIGILASIVLVSLNSARGNAKDAYIKSRLSASIPAAILYYEQNSSYKGFDPKISLETDMVSCAGSPVVNISSDGQEMAIILRSCTNGKIFFCNDTTSMEFMEVDATKYTSGESRCGESKSGGNVFDPKNKEVVLEKEIISVFSESTKDAYQRSLNLVSVADKTMGGQQEDIKLKGINLLDGHLGDIQFVFTTSVGAVIVNHQLEKNDSFSVQSRKAGQMDESFFEKFPSAKPGHPAVPDSMISIGTKGAIELLVNDETYKEYVEKYRDAFKNYTLSTIFDAKYGWEWKIVFSDNLEEVKKTVIFTVNTENDGVTFLEYKDLSQ